MQTKAHTKTLIKQNSEYSMSTVVKSSCDTEQDRMDMPNLKIP